MAKTIQDLSETTSIQNPCVDTNSSQKINDLEASSLGTISDEGKHVQWTEQMHVPASPQRTALLTQQGTAASSQQFKESSDTKYKKCSLCIIMIMQCPQI
eukprot:scpid86383/ scgid11432/ 